MIGRTVKSVIALAIVLIGSMGAGATQVARKHRDPIYPFNFSLSPRLGQITQTYFPEGRYPEAHPDFILIQTVHSDLFVQFSISRILKQLKNQEMLPDRIAVEGAVGPVNLRGMQQNPNARERRQIANYMMSQGEMTGATHFAATEGDVSLYGVESNMYYQSAVEMFRKSFYARLRLKSDLNHLESALNMLKLDPTLSTRASILAQDIQTIRHLVDLQLQPTEIHQVLNQAVFAVDHLKKLFPGKTERDLLEPVSAAVNFYAFALLRDNGLFTHSLDLRRNDQQKTTVLIVGGFHTTGLTRRIKEQGYSYVVITPVVGASNSYDERLYVQRLLGFSIPLVRPDADRPLLTFTSETQQNTVQQVSELRITARSLRKRLSHLDLSFPPIRDVFTAMDSPLAPALQVTLAKQRAAMLVLAGQMAFAINR